MDKFRLRASLGKIKEMRVKMNKTKKSKRNDSCISDFLSSPFSPVMADLPAGSSAEESASLTLNKKKILWKISFIEYRLKKFLVCRRLYLY